ncbi:phosphate ABC transporter substrate-binding protein [uncultured Intestinimonas sp.]|uniref:phosphate ABC transporter substrate-binding protein n=1 Tax=uncultured Intestinimonas sp. TaxID=1689265 RepID=UPI00262F9C31|nr:phosphate ABC transporter substrate-binding protein [uncultured Intestinimonas sp.]
MKKTLAMLLSLALCVGLFAGCSSSGSEESAAPSGSPSTETSAEPAGNEETSTLSGTVNLNGSTSVENVILTLGEAFMEANPDVTVNYDPTGSGTGINAALEGTCDLGLASRDLDEEETAQGLTSTVFALDGIAIIVNSENSVSDLTIEQIAGLATGEITNWSEVGGIDAPVVLIGREAGSGTRDGFESITGTGDTCVYTQELTSTGAVIQAVAGNPNAFGYASLSAVEGQDGVKAISVNGVAPSEETVLDGSYQVQRNFNFVYMADAELSDAAQAFMEYAVSADAADLVAGAGAVPVA